MTLRLALDKPLEAPAPDTRYCYSTDGESYYGDFATRAGALAEAHGELEEMLAEAEDPLKVWTAVRQPVDLAKLLAGLSLADVVLEHLAEASGEEYGEWAEGWPDLTQAQQEDLDAVLHAAILKWFAATDKTGPKFFSIDLETVEEHEVR